MQQRVILHSKDEELCCLLRSYRSFPLAYPMRLLINRGTYLAYNLKLPAGGTMEDGISHLMAVNQLNT